MDEGLKLFQSLFFMILPVEDHTNLFSSFMHLVVNQFYWVLSLVLSTWPLGRPCCSSHYALNRFFKPPGSFAICPPLFAFFISIHFQPALVFSLAVSFPFPPSPLRIWNLSGLWHDLSFPLICSCFGGNLILQQQTAIRFPVLPRLPMLFVSENIKEVYRKDRTTVQWRKERMSGGSAFTKGHQLTKHL